MANAYNKRYKVMGKDMDLGPLIFSVVMGLAMVATVFIKPSVTFLHHKAVIDSGIMFFGLFVGAAFWGLIEAFTPEGKSIYDLLWRIVVAFALGMLVGGFLAYYYSLGQYLLVAAYYGNVGALFFLMAAVITYFVWLYDAAWMHSRNFIRRSRK